MNCIFYLSGVLYDLKKNLLKLFVGLPVLNEPAVYFSLTNFTFRLGWYIHVFLNYFKFKFIYFFIRKTFHITINIAINISILQTKIGRCLVRYLQLVYFWLTYMIWLILSTPFEIILFLVYIFKCSQCDH